MPTHFLDMPTEIHERIFDLLRRSYIDEDAIPYNEDGLGILPPCKQLVRMPAWTFASIALMLLLRATGEDAFNL
jgi:hypothetical protein